MLPRSSVAHLRSRQRRDYTHPAVQEIRVGTPSAMWALRDPAIGFAVLGAAVAAGVLGANRARHAIRARYAGILLLACGLLGPVIAARVTLIHLDVAELFDAYVSPRGMTPQEARISGRGLDSNQVAVGSRIALWPGVGLADGRGSEDVD